MLEGVRKIPLDEGGERRRPTRAGRPVLPLPREKAVDSGLALKDGAEKLLVEAILSLRDEAECRAFLEDIATVQEIQALSHRLHVAKLLLEGRTYQEVVSATGASTATVSRVKRALYFGRSAMRTVLERLRADAGG